jgi:gluconolactonase
MKKCIHCYLFVFVLLMPALAVQAQVVAKGAQLQLLADGFKFTEGPAKSPEGPIYFTDQPNNRILKWDVESETLSTFLEPSGRSNGLYFDNEGALISCADANNQMWRIDSRGEHTVLIDSLDGQLLNAPNDLWIDADNGIYFTDPLYKRDYWTRGAPFLEKENVYYRTPQGEILTVIDDFVRPNGIIGDIKNGKLYISDIDDD